MKTLEQKYLEVLEDMDCRVCGYDENSGTVDVEWYSPDGEDFIFSADVEDFAQSVANYACDFDANEHATFWVRELDTPDVQTLIDDARAIEDFLYELAGKLREADEQPEGEQV